MDSSGDGVAMEMVMEAGCWGDGGNGNGNGSIDGSWRRGQRSVKLLVVMMQHARYAHSRMLL